MGCHVRNGEHRGGSDVAPFSGRRERRRVGLGNSPAKGSRILIVCGQVVVAFRSADGLDMEPLNRNSRRHCSVFSNVCLESGAVVWIAVAD